MPIPGNLLTTAMAVMPHTDIDRAMETALSLDIPFWPQLPNYSYYEGIHMDQILAQGLVSPATCCLVNEDGHKTVENAFQMTKELSGNLREKFKLN